MTEINLKDLYEMFYEDPDFKGGLAGNPNDSKEEAAWDEAKSRFKQHKNNEKALKVGINQNKAEEAKEIIEYWIYDTPTIASRSGTTELVKDMITVDDNVIFYQELMGKIRESIKNNTFNAFYNKYVNII